MTVTGQQQTAREKPWQAVTMIVPAATTTIQFIAFGQTGGSASWNGDISIDSISLTNAPAGCSFGNPSDIFQVTATSMGLTCGVGGMPISAAKGACYTTSSARCFTDGPGNHGNSESCTIRATQSVRLAVAGSFSMHGSDGFRITGSSTLRNTPQELNNYPVTTARNITWTSTSTVTRAGYTICVSFVSRPPCTVWLLIDLRLLGLYTCAFTFPASFCVRRMTTCVKPYFRSRQSRGVSSFAALSAASHHGTKQISNQVPNQISDQVSDAETHIRSDE
jgi:hypothetical protein